MPVTRSTFRDAFLAVPVSMSLFLHNNHIRRFLVVELPFVKHEPNAAQHHSPDQE
jgi:hypothetical protein